MYAKIEKEETEKFTVSKGLLMKSGTGSFILFMVAYRAAGIAKLLVDECAESHTTVLLDS